MDGKTEIDFNTLDDAAAVRRYVLEHGAASLRERDQRERTLLMRAAAIGDAALVTDCLGFGAEIDAADTRGWTALIFAVARNVPRAVPPSGHLAAARALLEQRANVHHRTLHGDTAIGLAVAAGDLEMTRLLSRFGADTG